MAEIKNIPVGKILITGDNPRKEFDLDKLNDLGESILGHGLLQPIIVRPKDDYYELVIGERRLRAALLKGVFEIEARIEDLDDATCMELRLIENIQRVDLTDADKGDGVYALMESHPEKYPTIAEVAKSLRTPVDTIYKWTDKSRKISKYVKSLTGLRKLSEDHVAKLQKYDHETQDNFADLILKHELTATSMRKFVKLYDDSPFSDLDELAKEAKGIKIVKIEMETLSPEARNEVEVIIEKKKKEMEKKRTESLEKARRAPRNSNIKSEPKVTEKKQAVKKLDPKVAEEINAVKAIAPEEIEEVVTETIAQEALKRKLEKPRTITPPRFEEPIRTQNLNDLALPFSVESKLTKQISNPMKRYEVGQAIKDYKFEEWETNRILGLARYRPNLSVSELVEKVKIESRKRKEKKFLMLEIPYGIWEKLDAETVKRKGPEGRLEIKETAIELLDERLKKLGH